MGSATENVYWLLKHTQIGSSLCLILHKLRFIPLKGVAALLGYKNNAHLQS